MADIFDTIEQQGKQAERSDFMKHPGRYRVKLKSLFMGETRKMAKMSAIEFEILYAKPLPAGAPGTNNQTFAFTKGTKKKIMTSVKDEIAYFLNDVRSWGHAIYTQSVVDGIRKGQYAQGTPLPTFDATTADVLRSMFSANSPAVGLILELDVSMKDTKNGGQMPIPRLHPIIEGNPEECPGPDWIAGL